MKKKNREQKVLNEAIKNILKNNNEDKEIVDIFKNSKDVSLENQERPDFIFEYKDGTKFGIEHFLIDQHTFISNEKYQSATRPLQNKVDSIIAQHEIDDSNDMENMISLLNQVSMFSGAYNYNYFLNNAKETIQNHYKKVGDYKRNIGFENNKTFIIFLIEILIDTNNIVTSDKNIKVLPLWDDLINELEKLKQRKIKYIVLHLIKEPENMSETIVVKTKNIKNQLKNKGYRVYNYIGLDRYVNNSARVDVKCEKTNDKLNLAFSISLESLKRNKNGMLKAIFDVYKAEKNGVLFATDKSTYNVAMSLDDEKLNALIKK